MSTPLIVTDALTTLERLKLFLGISSDSKDGMLIMMINQATGFIKQYTKRNFKETTYTAEEYDGSGTEIIVLKNFPVTALSTFQYNSASDNTDDWQTFDTKDYFWYADGRIRLNGKFTNEAQRYRATYTAGYKINFAAENDTAQHTLPFELEYAMHKIISGVYNTRQASGITAVRVGDQSVNYGTGVINDTELKGILDKYVATTIK